MNKPSKKLLDLALDITGERELEEYPKLLKLYTYTLDLEIEIERLNKCYCERTDCAGRIKNSAKFNSIQEENERLNNIIKRFEKDLREMYLTFGEFSEEYTEKKIKELKGSNKE